MSTTDLRRDLAVLVSVYAYKQAHVLLSQKSLAVNPDVMTLLELMTKRTQLMIEPLFDDQRQAYFQDRYAFSLANNSYDEELLANYLMVLESQLRIGDTIDFVRAVSPMIYRLFLRLATQQEPELLSYMTNARDDRYDTWHLSEMAVSSSVVLQTFASQTGDARVTSKSLHDLLLLCDLPEAIKALIKRLRHFEKSVRNPLAHLIKPFDEAELHRTTGFSSHDFLVKLIQLARYTGVIYDSDNFYFDRVNQLLLGLVNDETPSRTCS